LGYTVQSLCLFVIFTQAIRRPEWWFFKWLNWAPVMALGTISYTFYLSHLVIIKLIRSNTELSGFTGASLAFGGALVFSTLSYWAIERHAARLRKQLHREYSVRTQPAGP
jgi:peptidoglycan/LPS O-acetylase OafA/YrhL